MKVKSAKVKSVEKKVFAETGLEINIERADSWLGSDRYCFRMGIDSSKMWAYSVYNPTQGAINEPSVAFRTLAELVEAILESSDKC